MKIFDIRQNDLSIGTTALASRQNGCTNRQNTLANLREPEYIKNTRKGSFIILIFNMLLNNARLFNFIGQSFLLNNTKIFDNSGEPKYIKNTTVKGGNPNTLGKELVSCWAAQFSGQSFFIKDDLTNSFYLLNY